VRRVESQGYRPDIDGLRGLAVLAVIANHVSPALARGGFTGVDVFFVISGFLISDIIASQLVAGSFSAPAFYARRIRRLLPSLSLVLMATIGVGWFVLSGPALEELSGDVVAAAIFVSNLRLWRTADYFAPDSATRPLLHLWSLGIEEQFYLLWPLTLSAIWRWPRRLGVVGGVAIVSFAWSVLWASSNSVGAFYSPATRMWELLLGCMLALAGTAPGNPWRTGRLNALCGMSFGEMPDARVRNIASVVGLTLVLLGMWLVNEASRFPGYWALLPCVGTALLIASGEAAWVNRILFSNRAMVGIGLLSYPLYLLHWPLLVFMRLTLPDASYLVKLLLLGTIVPIAYLAYRFVELPVRQRARLGVTRGLVAAQIVLVLGGLSIVLQRGVPRRFTEPRRSLMVIRAPDSLMMSLERKGSCFLRLDQTAGAFTPDCIAKAEDGAAPGSVLIWGDSFAASLIPGIRESLAPGASLQQLTAAGCAPITSAVEDPRWPHCVAINRYIDRYVRQALPRTVILSARWNMHSDIDRVSSTIGELRRAGVPRIVVVGSLIQFEQPLPRLLLQSLHVNQTLPRRIRVPSLPALRVIDSTLRHAAKLGGAEFVAPLDVQCSPEGCLATLDGTAASVTTWDEGHLTLAGSRFVARHLLLPYLSASPRTAAKY
jgi:peptidoglycan/LPS O-acetylase OafA/YrhL